MVTSLGLEKYGKINFSLGKWMFIDPNALKLMWAYAKDSGTFDGTQIHSFLATLVALHFTPVGEWVSGSFGLA